MPESSDSSEKRSRTRVGVGNTEIEHESTGRSAGGSSYEGGGTRPSGGYDDDRDYGYGGGGGDYDDDYQSRARRDTRDAGDSIRDSGRAVRRDATDLFSVGCDFLSGIFYGIGDVLSPRRRGGRSGSSYDSGGSGSATCLDECGVAFRGYGRSDDDYGGGRPRRSQSRDAGVERERVSTSRTVRRTYP